MTAAPSIRVFEVGDFHRGERLDRFLQAMVPKMSRSSVQLALAEGRVKLASGLEAKASRRLVAGERVTLRGRVATGELPEAPAVLARGTGWCVVDKPAGMRTTPTSRDPGRDVHSLTGLSPAHRLDRFTSGALLLTDDPAAARYFEPAFREGRVKKEYAAVLQGRPERASWTCTNPIGPQEGSRVLSKVTWRAEGTAGAQEAATRFTVAATIELPSGDWTLVRAEPRTGRRHQVRVHAAASGHPLVGELLHAGDERDFVRFQLGQAVELPAGIEPGRHLLHARSLAFTAPTGEAVVVVAPWPADYPELLTRCWESLDSESERS